MSINEIQAGTSVNQTKAIETVKNEPKAETLKTVKSNEPQKDTVTISGKENAPEIAMMRVLCHYLTDEQIRQVNETGYLPANAKFIPNNAEQPTGYNITYNIFNVSEGTRKLPQGYELQRDVLGFTRVVPQETQGLFLRRVSE